jgi:quinol monooxygenase YgiN
MQVARREFLECVVAATAIAVAPGFASAQGANAMSASLYGLIAKLASVPGKREELMNILIAGTREMPGCFSYVVAKDAADENAVWVTEIWDSVASHDAAFSLPAVKDCIAQSKPLIAGFERVATTNPVGGVGLRAKQGR